ncbi:hypothetical protein HNR23_003809 [Nocardiopsis mwathae]|uniref:Uncharacterized protein n=1 Tax=Nocardiopsis mwathae TaxID=1472723 RepID=A0A7X0D883_9ACTN|nr:hypothetical protein [Nocardiopsis mwathae]
MLLAVASTTIVGLSTIRSYTPSPLSRPVSEGVTDAPVRLAFLRSELESGGGERMQALFPEGYFFTHALYGLSWINVARLDRGYGDRALQEARWALARLESPAGTGPFPTDAEPAYGVFHAGWTAWLRGRIVELAGGPEQAPDEAAALRADAEELRDAFDDALDSGTPYLAAYPGQSWPVDSVVAVAALELDDRLHGSFVHADTVRAWTHAVQARLDPVTGLIPHRVDAGTGEPIQGARGSSQALLLRFLAEIDPEWAAADYRTFRSLFTSDVGMLPGVREYPRDDDSPGDIDSGPLIYGLSASASTVALGNAILFYDKPTADALTGFAEATGMAVESGGRRFYLGGAVPVGDAFMVWSLTALGESAGVSADTGMNPTSETPGWWRVPWHVGTGAVLVLLWSAAFYAWRPRIRRRPLPGAAGASAP